MSDDNFISLTVDNNSVEAVRKKLDEFIKYTDGKGINKAIKVSAQPLLARARGNAFALRGTKGDKNMSGKIGNALRISPSWAGKKRRKGYYAVRVQVDPKQSPQFIHIAKSSKYKAGRTYIPTSIEYGHIAVNGRKVPAKPYMRPALHSAASEVRYRFRDELSQMMDDFFKSRASK